MENRIEAKLQNPDINDRYVSVFRHRGIDICTLKRADPSNGDSLGYVIDHNYYKFVGKTFSTVFEAVGVIDENWCSWGENQNASDYIPRN